MLWPVPAPSGEGTVVILGCKDGSAALQTRIDTAADYLNAHPDTVAVASGGLGAKEWRSEAEAIRSGLEQRGISSERVYLEDQSTNTKENLAYTCEILKSQSLNPTIIIVTERYHMFRALQIAQEHRVTRIRRTGKNALVYSIRQLRPRIACTDKILSVPLAFIKTRLCCIIMNFSCMKIYI